jgi:Tol biopolymer transport system component
VSRQTPVLLLALTTAFVGFSQMDSADAQDRGPVALATPTSAPIGFLRGGSAKREIVLVRPDGTGTRTLVRTRRGTWLNDFTWAPRGRRIAFSLGGARMPHDEIRIANVDGGGIRRVARGPGFGGPEWSPDGTRIAIHRSDDGIHQIWVVRADGRNLRRLTPGSDFGAPSWSPNGRRIAYSDLRGGWLCVMRAEGIGKRRVARGGEPSWAPIGDTIASVSEDLWVVGADGRGRRHLADLSFLGRSIAWSPDGTSIAFSSRIGGLDEELAVVDVATGAIRRLTDNEMQDLSPSWSPDGRSLAFLRYRPGFGGAVPGPADVYVVNADGTGERNLTKSPIDETLPLWAPR